MLERLSFVWNTLFLNTSLFHCNRAEHNSSQILDKGGVAELLITTVNSFVEQTHVFHFFILKFQYHFHFNAPEFIRGQEEILLISPLGNKQGRIWPSGPGLIF